MVSKDKQSAETESTISNSMWISSFLIGLSSFLFGYALASLNSCLVLGDGNSASACYNGDDNNSPNCPKGTLYDDLDLSTCKFIFIL